MYVQDNEPHLLKRVLMMFCGVWPSATPQIASFHDMIESSRPVHDKHCMQIDWIRCRFEDKDFEMEFRLSDLHTRLYYGRIVGISILVYVGILLANFPLAQYPFSTSVCIFVAMEAFVLCIFSAACMKKMARMIHPEHNRPVEASNGAWIRVVYLLDILAYLILLSICIATILFRIEQHQTHTTPLTIMITCTTGPHISFIPFTYSLSFYFIVLVGFLSSGLDWENQNRAIQIAFALAFCMFSGGYLLYKRSLFKRLHFRALSIYYNLSANSDVMIKQATGNIFRQVYVKSKEAMQEMKAQSRLMRFKNGDINSAFQREYENRSIFILTLSVLVQIVISIIFLLPSGWSPLPQPSREPHFKNYVILFIWISAVPIIFWKPASPHRSFFFAFICAVTFSLHLYTTLHMDEITTDGYIIYVWRAFDLAATSLCLDIRHLFWFVLYGSALLNFMGIYGQPYFEPINLGLLLLWMFLTFLVALQTNQSGRLSYWFKHWHLERNSTVQHPVRDDTFFSEHAGEMDDFSKLYQKDQHPHTGASVVRTHGWT